jgi:hypothetical protein
MPSPDAVRAFVRAPAVQREVNALMEQRFPEVGALVCAPFPRKTPAGAMELGRPIASAVLVQEYLIGLVFLRICGWGFMIVGALFVLIAVLGCITMAFEPPRPNRDVNYLCGMIPVAMIGLGAGGAGAWFGILRGRVVNQMCWLSARGMVWMTGSVFEWYAWEEVPEVYCMMGDARPAIGIRFEGDVAWISFSNTHASPHRGVHRESGVGCMDAGNAAGDRGRQAAPSRKLALAQVIHRESARSRRMERRGRDREKRARSGHPSRRARRDDDPPG